MRQQTGRWHRRQNALWQGVAADRANCKTCPELLQLDTGGIRAWELQQQARAELTDQPWTWNDIVTYPTLL